MASAHDQWMAGWDEIQKITDPVAHAEAEAKMSRARELIDEYEETRVFARMQEGLTLVREARVAARNYAS